MCVTISVWENSLSLTPFKFEGFVSKIQSRKIIILLKEQLTKGATRSYPSCTGWGEVFDHWYSLELLVHGDNKKQTGFWPVSLQFLDSLQTTPFAYYLPPGGNPSTPLPLPWYATDLKFLLSGVKTD